MHLNGGKNGAPKIMMYSTANINTENVSLKYGFMAGTTPSHLKEAESWQVQSVTKYSDSNLAKSSSVNTESAV